MAGHTITLVGDDIYIIGGYDRVRGFSERSYKYNVITKVWANLTTSGPSPKGLYRPWWWLFRGPVIIYRMGGGDFGRDRYGGGSVVANEDERDES